MKYPTILFIGAFILNIAPSFSQDVVLTNGENIQLISDTNFYINGIGLTPSSDYLITSENSISKSSVPINNNSILRVVSAENLISNYEGLITLFYEDSELNGTSENDLELQVKNESGVWTNYASNIDTGNNSILYNFTSPISFYAITASNSTSLSSKNFFLNNIQIHPNPTNSIITLKGKTDVTSTLYNLVGRKIIKTRKNSIDLKDLSSGTYLLHILDNNSNAYIVRKIIKN